MKYHGQPFLHVIDYKRAKEVFCFPESGIYETDDEKLIAWMKKNKPHIRCEEVEEAKIEEPEEPNELKETEQSEEPDKPKKPEQPKKPKPKKPKSDKAKKPTK